MKLQQYVQKLERFTRDNSTSLLAATAVTGIITTGYFAAKAGYESAGIIAEAERTTPYPLSTKEKFLLVWKRYIPATSSGAVGIAAIIGSASINARRTAALTAAYSITEKAFSEYKEKVIETIGDNKERKIRDEIASEKVQQNPPNATNVIVGSGDVLCLELHTGRYFQSDMETLRRAQNDINSKLISQNEATLSDLYYILSIPQTSSSSYSGWTSEKMLSLEFSSQLHEGKPCLAFDYNYIKVF